MASDDLRRHILALAALATLSAGAWLLARHLVDPLSHLPTRFMRELPPETRRVLLVVSPSQSSRKAQIWLLQRHSIAGKWEISRGPIAAILGRNGLAWGRGEHRASAPVGFPAKKEGDGCSPAGIFRVPFAFGLAEPVQAARLLRMKYVMLTDGIVGVEDPASRHYNQIVDATQVTADWDDGAPMNRRGEFYRWGAFVAHNPENIPGEGSCILLHQWPGSDIPTAGCTGMEEQNLVRILEWLDPAMEPRLVQSLSSW